MRSYINIEAVCDEINEIEEQIVQLKNRLEKLYAIRQEYWQKERGEAILEYERSVL